MANTYSQIYIHVIFSPSNPNMRINPDWEEELHKYTTGIISNKGQKLIAVNSTINHIHMLIGMKPNCSLSDLIREVKKSSNAFINQKGLANNYFKWQFGFGAFSCGYSQLDQIIAYINNQKEHHKTMSFEEEYIRFLENYHVDYDMKYVFD